MDISSLRGDFFFDPKTTGDKVIQAINGPNPQVDLDALFWESMKNSKNPKNFSAYLLKFPQGVFAEIARNRLTELNVAPPARAPPIRKYSLPCRPWPRRPRKKPAKIRRPPISQAALTGR